MRERSIGLLAMAAMLLIAFGASQMKTEQPARRVHQHLADPAPKEACSVSGTGLCTHLPLVLIDTAGEEIPGVPLNRQGSPEIFYSKTETGEAMREATLAVVDHPGSYNHPEDAPTLSSDIRIRVRGNSSRFFEKKSYLVRLTDETGAYQDQAVMGMDPHYEWVLHGPYLDKSLIRNYMWYNIAGEIMEYAPNVRFCEVLLNGEYQGLYVMTETITGGEDSRLRLTEPMEQVQRTGYVVRVDVGSADERKNFRSFTDYAYRNLMQKDIQYPRAGKLTPEIARFIEQDLSDFEKALYSYDYDTEDYGYWNEIDVDSFVDYFIINEFTANYDAGGLSTYLYRDVGGKFHMAVWDFNSACDNYVDSVMTPQHLELQDRIWYYMLMKDEHFTERILSRYRELRKGCLSDAYLDAYLEQVEDYLGDAVRRNNEVWGDSLDRDMLRPADRNPHSQQEALEQMKRFLHERGAWLDAHLETILQYSHESKIKKFNH